MFSYVTLVWDDLDAEQREAAADACRKIQHSSRDLVQLHRSAGLAVYGTPSSQNGRIRTYLAAAGNGVIFGNLFARGAGGSIEVSDYETLTSKYFGRYVAVFKDAGTKRVRICRDPTGGVHCYQLQHRKLQVFVRRLNDFTKYFGGSFSVNWHYLKGQLVYSSLQLKETALNEVTEVQPGECLTFERASTTSSFFWNPLSISQDRIEDLNSAVEQLREATQCCVSAWASCHESIVHMLSGGLDSSIVMSCLNRLANAPKVTCLNYFSKGADTDERSYARLVATAFDCELVEQERQFFGSLRNLLKIPKSPYPYSYLGYLIDGRNRAKLAQEHGATAIFSGHGGDALFYAGKEALAVADYLHAHPFNPRAFGIAWDVAPLEGDSVWRLLADSMKQVWFGQAWKLQREAGLYNFLLSKALAEEVKADDTLIHPLFRDMGSVPSGKRFQAHSVTYMMTPRYDPFERSDDPDEVSPLLSQPLVEVCLRIPTYVLTNNGRDRDVARRAFAQRLPREIVTRRSKGGMEEDIKRNVNSNLDLIRELMLDGQLVRQGFLDRALLEKALVAGLTASRSFPLEIYDYLYTEAWLQNWPEAMRADAA